MQDFLIPFATIGLAEMGDKTQLALFCLASRTRRRLALLLGAILAFAVNDGIAILIGGLASKFIPLIYVKILAGAIFLGFGLLTLFRAPEEEVECEIRQPFLTSFTMILVSEMGDKTQVATALFATSYNPLLVLLGVVSVLGLLSAAAIYLGQSLFARIDPRKRAFLAGSLFILIGLWQFAQILHEGWR